MTSDGSRDEFVVWARSLWKRTRYSVVCGRISRATDKYIT